MWPPLVDTWGYQKISDPRWHLLHICRCGHDLRNNLQATGTQPSMQTPKQAEFFCVNAEHSRSLFVISQFLIRRTHIQLRCRVAERWEINLPRPIPGTRSISQLPVTERAKYLAAARNILDDWPNTFIEVMLEIKISRQQFSILFEAIPSSMQDQLTEQLAKRRSNAFARAISFE